MKSFIFALTVALAGFAMLATSLSAHAQPVLMPDSSLSGDDPDGTPTPFGDAYGAGGAAWGDWLFVGAPREEAFRDGADFQDGAVYIYKKDGGGAYVFEQKLAMPGSSVIFSDRFGGGIEAEAGWLFVGSANDQDFPGLVDPRAQAGDPLDPDFIFAGQVHVYKLTGSSWDYVQTLTAPTPKSFGSFGARSQASHIALNSKGKVAVIGELNNFVGGMGQLHTYRLKKGSKNPNSVWEFVQSIDAPTANIGGFGDEVIFATDKYLVVGGNEFDENGLNKQGFAFVYKAHGNSGTFSASPTQTISGGINDASACFAGFGEAGMAAGRKVVAIADPCVDGVAGANTGHLKVYRVTGGSSPLTFEATIEGDESSLFLGGNVFGSRHPVAVSENDDRILAGTPMSPDGGFFSPTSIGGDVRVYFDDPLLGWVRESNLTTATPAVTIFRAFGDTVFFADDETAFIRETNFIDPVVTGFKSQGLLYDLTP